MSNVSPALPSPSGPIAAAPAHDAWAEVRAHDHVMRYRRSGSGRSVLVLAPAAATASVAADHALWPELADALARRFRVIVPDVPPPPAGGGADVAAWLGDFLDGLGMARVALVAAEPFCVAALELALLDVERVARVVLVPGGPAVGGEGDAGLDGALASAAGAGVGGVSVPLLVVRRGLPAAEGVAAVSRFLSRTAGTPAAG